MLTESKKARVLKNGLDTQAATPRIPVKSWNIQPAMYPSCPVEIFCTEMIHPGGVTVCGDSSLDITKKECSEEQHSGACIVGIMNHAEDSRGSSQPSHVCLG